MVSTPGGATPDAGGNLCTLRRTKIYSKIFFKSLLLVLKANGNHRHTDVDSAIFGALQSINCDNTLVVDFSFPLSVAVLFP